MALCMIRCTSSIRCSPPSMKRVVLIISIAISSSKFASTPLPHTDHIPSWEYLSTRGAKSLKTFLKWQMLMYHLLCAAKETINSSLIYHQIFLDYSIEYNMPKICDHTNKNLIQDYCRKSYAFHIIRVVPAINYIVSRELLGNFVNINKFID